MKRLMNTSLGLAFWGESMLASVAAFLAVLTAVWPNWLEGVFGFDPDHYNGSVEWGIVAVCFVVTVVCLALARREWHRAAQASG